MNFNNCVFITS